MGYGIYTVYPRLIFSSNIIWGGGRRQEYIYVFYVFVKSGSSELQTKAKSSERITPVRYPVRLEAMIKIEEYYYNEVRTRTLGGRGMHILFFAEYASL